MVGRGGEAFSTITVLALRVGRHSFSDHVRIIPLRSIGSHSRLSVLFTLIKQSWIKRKEYDAVFVRGDPYYVLFVHGCGARSENVSCFGMRTIG